MNGRFLVIFVIEVTRVILVSGKNDI